MNRERSVKEAPGRTVDDPATGQRIGPVPVAVEDSPFWRRRIKDGDVVEVPNYAIAAPKSVLEVVESPDPPAAPAATAGRKARG